MTVEEEMILTDHRRVKNIKEECGGYWDEHPDWPHVDWASECINNETRQGYWEWVDDQVRNRD